MENNGSFFTFSAYPLFLFNYIYFLCFSSFVLCLSVMNAYFLLQIFKEVIVVGLKVDIVKKKKINRQHFFSFNDSNMFLCGYLSYSIHYLNSGLKMRHPTMMEKRRKERERKREEDKPQNQTWSTMTVISTKYSRNQLIKRKRANKRTRK